MDDQELMARLAAGDNAALEELIHRHRPAALRQARSMLGDEALAQDAVQEAFVRVYLLRASYRPEFAFTTYLAAIVRNLCLDEIRRRRLRPVPAQDLPEGLEGSAEAAWLEKEKRMALWRSLSRLSAQDQALLTGYALEGLTYQQLARREGLSLTQVRIRLHRIRQRLRKERDGE
ncbi:MAG: sigma-70 family RNA polymerase sigma factor [Eubacteriales bacterium]|nr:sigma-70 family RNA polymerase sigma factor [Eubacteriales bacterium]